MTKKNGYQSENFLQCKEEGENKRRKKSKVKILTEIGGCLAIYL